VEEWQTSQVDRERRQVAMQQRRGSVLEGWRKPVTAKIDQYS
jgi:hypothetical protein